MTKINNKLSYSCCTFILNSKNALRTNVSILNERLKYKCKTEVVVIL